MSLRCKLEFKIVLLIVFALSIAPFSSAAWSRGSVVLPARGISFLAKFCFDSDPSSHLHDDASPDDLDNGVGSIGTYRVWLHSDVPGDGVITFVGLDDQAESYPDEYAMRGFECGSNVLKAAAHWIQNVSVSDLQKGVAVPDAISAQFIYQALRRRWWYMAVVDCSGTERLIDYSAHMLNTKQGYLQEFSMDRITPFSLGIFLSLYAILCIAQLAAILLSSSETAKHPLRCILTLSVTTALCGMLLQELGSIWFAHHGEDILLVYLGAKFLKAVSKYSLLSMLMLISKGRCISHPLLLRDLCRVSITLVPFFATCLILELWGEWAESRKYTTDFVYCTRFGGALVLADLFLLALYARSILRSYSAEIDVTKKMFYRTWGLVYIVAFAILPASVVVALLVSPWVRNYVIVVSSNITHLILLTLLVIGLWPEKTQPFFCIDNSELAATYGVTESIRTELLDVGGEVEQGSMSPPRRRSPKSTAASPRASSRAMTELN